MKYDRILGLLFFLIILLGGRELPRARAQTTYQNTQRRAGRLLQKCEEQQQAALLLAARETCERALATYRGIGDRPGEVQTVERLGAIALDSEAFLDALQWYRDAAAIYSDRGDREREREMLFQLGSVYERLYQLELLWAYRDREIYQFDEVVAELERSLAFERKFENRLREAAVLNRLAAVRSVTGEKEEAIALLERSLEIVRAFPASAEKGDAIAQIAFVYWNVDRVPTAFDLYAEAIANFQTVGDFDREFKVWKKVAFIHEILDREERALATYEAALERSREVGDGLATIELLDRIAAIYQKRGNDEEMLAFLRQSLLSIRAVDAPRAEALTLEKIGNLFLAFEQPEKSLISYQQALGIFREMEDWQKAGNVLEAIGSLYARSNDIAAASFFYKQAIDAYETFRRARVLPTDEEETLAQISDATDVAEAYRRLADLLLQQNRLLEAQAALERLKFEEIRQFTEHATLAVPENFPLRRGEKQLRASHDGLIAAIRHVERCNPSRCGGFAEIEAERDRWLEIYARDLEALPQAIAAEDFRPKKLRSLGKDLLSVEPHTALIYYLLAGDRVWLFWKTADGSARAVWVENTNRQQIEEYVLAYRQFLQSPDSDLKPLKAFGQKLYDRLFAPLAADLEQKEVRHLLFALDGATRYLPVAALFDGDKYLVERYSVSRMLSAALTDASERFPQNPKVLAMGISEAQPGFESLPYVLEEIDTVLRNTPTEARGAYPGEQFLDRAFTRKALGQNLPDKQILHLATHCLFFPGRQEDSYLLLGDGTRLTVRDVEAWERLADVHLAFLSASRTAPQSNGLQGVELPGIGYYFFQGGVKSLMLSLWQVGDRSHRFFVENFYANLAKETEANPMTKAEALRRSQLVFLKGSYEHPYYWAAPILIGNRW